MANLQVLLTFESSFIDDSRGIQRVNDNVSNVIHCNKCVGKRCQSLQQFVEISVLFLPRYSNTLNRRKYFSNLWKCCSLRCANPIAFFSISSFFFLFFNSIFATNEIADVWKWNELLLNRRGIFQWIGAQQNGQTPSRDKGDQTSNISFELHTSRTWFLLITNPAELPWQRV